MTEPMVSIKLPRLAREWCGKRLVLGSTPTWVQVGCGFSHLQNGDPLTHRHNSLSLLQGIFPTQGSNPGIPHCRQILYQLSHKRSPRILEWVAYSISSRSSRPRNRTRVSCIAGGFFANLSIRGAIKEVEWQRTDAFQLWCWRRLLRVPSTARRANQSILK